MVAKIQDSSACRGLPTLVYFSQCLVWWDVIRTWTFIWEGRNYFLETQKVLILNLWKVSEFCCLSHKDFQKWQQHLTYNKQKFSLRIWGSRAVLRTSARPSDVHTYAIWIHDFDFFSYYYQHKCILIPDAEQWIQCFQVRSVMHK